MLTNFPLSIPASNCLDHNQRHKRQSSRLTTSRIVKDESSSRSQPSHTLAASSVTTVPARTTRSTVNGGLRSNSIARSRYKLPEESDTVEDDEDDEIIIRRTNNVIKTFVETSSRKRSVHQNLTQSYKIPLIILTLALITFLITRYFPIGEWYPVKSTNPIDKVLNVQHVPSHNPTIQSSNMTVCPKCPIACPASDDIKELNLRLNSLEKMITELKNQKAYEPPPQPIPLEDPKINQLFKEIDLIRRDHRTNLLQIDEKIEQISQAIHNHQPQPQQLCPSNNPSMEEIEAKIRQALQIYDADKTGMADFALESSGTVNNQVHYLNKNLTKIFYSGGSIVSTRCSETYEPYIAEYRIWGLPIWYTSNSPRVVIQTSMAPGECWAFIGDTGRLVIKLSAPIVPTYFHYEHISKSLSREGDIRSAPKDFKVLGLEDENDPEGVELGNYIYLDNNVPLQRFEVEVKTGKKFQFIELVVLSNHGHPDYTCLYRFRVHGKRV